MDSLSSISAASHLHGALNKQANPAAVAKLNAYWQGKTTERRNEALGDALRVLLGGAGVGLGVRGIQGLGNLVTRNFVEDEAEEETIPTSVYALKTSAEDPVMPETVVIGRPESSPGYSNPAHPSNQKPDRQGRSPYDPNYDPNAPYPPWRIGGKRVSLPGIGKSITQMARQVDRTAAGGLREIGKAIGRGSWETAKDVLGIHGVPSKATNWDNYDPKTRSFPDKSLPQWFLDKSGAMSPMLRNALKTSAEKSADPTVLDDQSGPRAFWSGAKYPLALGGGAAGLYGGWKVMDYLLDKRRESETDDDLDLAKAEYEAALSGDDKSAADQEIGRELDLLFDRCIEKTSEAGAALDKALDSKEADWTGTGIGLYGGMYALPSATLAALLSYPFFSKRQRSKLLSKATKQHEIAQEAKSPQVIQLKVDSPADGPEVSEDEENPQELAVDISPTLDFEDSLDRV